jgi:hypothetical protein
MLKTFEIDIEKTDLSAANYARENSLSFIFFLKDGRKLLDTHGLLESGILTDHEIIMREKPDIICCCYPKACYQRYFQNNAVESVNLLDEEETKENDYSPEIVFADCYNNTVWVSICRWTNEIDLYGWKNGRQYKRAIYVASFTKKEQDEFYGEKTKKLKRI